MKPSKYVSKLAWIHVSKKKNRSYLSIISVLLSTTIIFVSLVLFSTVFNLSKNTNDHPFGHSHYYLQTSTLNQYDPFQFSITKLIDANQEIDDHPFTYLSYQNNLQIFDTLEGKLPSQENEIIVPRGFNLNNSSYNIVGYYTPSQFMDNLFEQLPIIGHYDDSIVGSMHCFIYDEKIQDEASLATVSYIGNVDFNQIVLNEDFISSDSKRNYLKDTTTMLIMFIGIIIIASFMSLVSIYNVLIVNDQDLRKEIGLLKSIGMTRVELKKMLLLELTYIGVIGATIGVLFGIGISSTILYVLLNNLKSSFNVMLVLKPIPIIISFLLGIIFMVVSGYFVYKHYLDSKPIDDLKGNVVQYDIPYDSNRFSISTITWRLFVIYNERIKKQTKNLRRSFFLLMFTTTLFCGIWFSNFLFINQYKNVNYDFRLETAELSSLGTKHYYEDVDQSLYNLKDQEDTKLTHLKIFRNIIGLEFAMQESSYTPYYLEANSSLSTQVYEGEMYYKDTYRASMVDDMQLQELEPYLVCGDFESLNEDSLILTINQHHDFIDETRAIRHYDLHQPVVIHEILDHGNTNDYIMYVDAIVVFPSKNTTLAYSYLNEGTFNLLFRKENIPKLNSDLVTVNYEVSMALDNPANRVHVNKQLQDILSNCNRQNELKMIDYIQIQNDGQFAVFMIEVLMYPLLFMLVIIGMININNVLKGNIHMKHTDFSTMKSVGMTSAQLRGIMMYEYAENYINAGGITFLLCIPIYLLEKIFSVASVFKIGDNFTGMFIMSFMIISPVIILLLAKLSFKELNKISAIDGMKDTE